MSREVIGSGAAVREHERAPAPRHDARPARLTDLDAAPPPASEPADVPAEPAAPRRSAGWPASAPWWLGGPAGVVGAVVVGLIAGALLGAGAAERSAAERRAESINLLGGLTYPEVQSSSIPEGAVPMDLLVVNAGPEALTVTGVEFVDTTATTVTLAERFEIGVGETVRTAAAVRLDCTGPTVSGVSATVQTRDGRTRRVELGTFDDVLTTVSSDNLRSACEEGFEAPQAVEVQRLTAHGDGSISLQVRNARTDDDVEVGIDSPLGTTIVSEPPLPITLSGGSGQVLIISLRIDDCRAVSIRPGAGANLGLTVDGRGGAAYLDPVVTSGWFARQVALGCG